MITATAQQIGPQRISVRFSSPLQALGPLKHPANWEVFGGATFATEVEVSYIDAGTGHDLVEEVILSLAQPWITGGLQITANLMEVDAFTDEYADIIGYPIVCACESLKDQSYYWITIEGIPENYPYDVPVEESTFWIGSGAHVSIPQDYIDVNSISSIGQKLDPTKGVVMGDNITIRLIDTDGRLSNLFGIDDTGVEMQVWETQSGSAVAENFLRATTILDQDLTLITRTAGDFFTVGDYFWIGSNCCKVNTISGSGNFGGQDIYTYNVSTRQARSQLETVQAQQVATSRPTYFSGRRMWLWCYNYVKHGVNPICLYAGVMDEPKIDGLDVWTFTARDMSSLAIARGMKRLGTAYTNPVFDLGVLDKYTVYLRRVPAIDLEVGASSAQETATYGFFIKAYHYGFWCSAYHMIRAIVPPYGVEGERDANDNWDRWWHRNMSRTGDIVEIDLERFISLEQLKAKFAGILEWDGDRFVPAGVTTIDRDANENGAADVYETLPTNVYFPICKTILTHHDDDIDYTGGDAFEYDPQFTHDSDTKRILDILGLGGWCSRMEELGQEDTDKTRFPVDADIIPVTGIWFQSESPSNSINFDTNNDTEIRIDLKRNPDRTSDTITNTMNYDLSALEVERGWDEFANQLTRSSRGCSANALETGNKPVDTFIKYSDTYMFARPQVKEINSGFFDCLYAKPLRPTDGIDYTEQVVEALRVGWMHALNEGEADHSPFPINNPFQWLLAYLTSTPHGNNGDWDCLPGHHGLGIDEADIDISAFEKAIARTPGLGVQGWADAETENLLYEIGKRICLPLGYFLVFGRDGTVTVKQINRLMEHEDSDYVATISNILTSRLDSTAETGDAYSGIELNWDQEDMPPGQTTKRLTIKEVSGIKRATGSSTLSVASWVFGPESQLTVAAQGKILPMIRRSPLELELDFPEVDLEGVRWMDVVPGDVVELEDVVVPNRANTRALTAQAVVMSTKHDIPKGIVTLGLRVLGDYDRRRGYAFSGNIVQVSGNYIYIRKNELIDPDAGVDPVVGLGTAANVSKAWIRYNNQQDLDGTNTITMTAATTATVRGYDCIRLTVSGSYTMDTISGGTPSSTTTLYLSGTSAESRYWNGMSIFLDDLTAMPSSPAVVDTVSTSGGETIITLSGALSAAPSSGTRVWTAYTSVVSADDAQASDYQLYFSYAASGSWRHTGSVYSWSSPPITPSVDGSRLNVTFYS